MKAQTRLLLIVFVTAGLAGCGILGGDGSANLGMIFAQGLQSILGRGGCGRAEKAESQNSNNRKLEATIFSHSRVF